MKTPLYTCKESYYYTPKPGVEYSIASGSSELIHVRSQWLTLRMVFRYEKKRRRQPNNLKLEKNYSNVTTNTICCYTDLSLFLSALENTPHSTPDSAYITLRYNTVGKWMRDCPSMYWRLLIFHGLYYFANTALVSKLFLWKYIFLLPIRKIIAFNIHVKQHLYKFKTFFHHSEIIITHVLHTPVFASRQLVECFLW